MHALADPVPVWDHGTARWSDAVYTRLRASLGGGRTGAKGWRVASSRAPLRVNVLALRLHTLVAAGWRPQDTSLLDDHAADVERWTLSAVELLGDRPPTVSLRLPCPSCGERFTYRRSAGESVRKWALRVSEDGCECQVCKAFWEPTEFHWLARLLGCEALP